jgi:hypothetical protein
LRRCCRVLFFNLVRSGIRFSRQPGRHDELVELMRLVSSRTKRRDLVARTAISTRDLVAFAFDLVAFAFDLVTLGGTQS